jgi:hypothetical protein
LPTSVQYSLQCPHRIALYSCSISCPSECKVLRSSLAGSRQQYNRCQHCIQKLGSCRITSTATQGSVLHPSALAQSGDTRRAMRLSGTFTLQFIGTCCNSWLGASPGFASQCAFNAADAGSALGTPGNQPFAEVLQTSYSCTFIVCKISAPRLRSRKRLGRRSASWRMRRRRAGCYCGGWRWCGVWRPWEPP